MITNDFHYKPIIINLEGKVIHYVYVNIHDQCKEAKYRLIQALLSA